LRQQKKEEKGNCKRIVNWLLNVKLNTRRELLRLRLNARRLRPSGKKKRRLATSRTTSSSVSSRTYFNPISRSRQPS
jgi:hypothetical protein